MRTEGLRLFAFRSLASIGMLIRRLETRLFMHGSNWTRKHDLLLRIIQISCFNNQAKQLYLASKLAFL